MKDKSSKKIFIVAILLAAILYLPIRMYILGVPSDYHISDIKKSGDEMVITGEIIDSAKAYTRHNFRKDNSKKTLEIYGALSSFLHKSSRFEIREEIGIPMYIKDKYIDEWGNILDKKTIEIYNHKVKYIGSGSEVINLLSTIDIGKNFGEYKVVLETDEKPYVLNINLNDEIDRKDLDKKLIEMKNFGIIILQLIENADEINYNYSTDYKANSLNIKKSDYADIKITSPLDLQELIDKLEVN
ncbi:MAG: DUF4825 domain-containing protein [Tissierellia bacterium]|nr:DUF4825 domain-containing protein [Tissierellia bacterium]